MKNNPRLSAGIIPFLRGTEVRFLILRSYNYWDFPKGLVESHEDPFVAAQRELKEETGIESVSFPFAQTFVETEPYSNGKVARYYLGEVFTDKVVLGVNPELGHPEHQEYRWVNFAEARRLLGERVGKVLQWGQGVLGKSLS